MTNVTSIVVPTEQNLSIEQLTTLIHGLNVQAGWWTNLETGEDLIPKLEEKKLEYLRQGNEFGFNVTKEKIKERLIELNTVRWVLDNSTNDTEEVK